MVHKKIWAGLCTSSRPDIIRPEPRRHACHQRSAGHDYHFGEYCIVAQGPPEIWTIGHSTRSLEEFIGLLQEQQIEGLADVRQFPGSRRYPHFGRDHLEQELKRAGIDYVHYPELGGRRAPRPDSPNNAWRNKAFRGYADYMSTEPFVKGFQKLTELAKTKRTAMMCAEAVWWSCHRSLLADLFKSKGWRVLHIMGANKIQEHPYTGAARIVNGRLSYEAEQPLVL
jgi:uncharacterized protein (DUF488 family)